MPQQQATRRIAGADAARIGKQKGWAVVVVEEGRLVEILFARELRTLADSIQLVAVDIPIALPGDEGVLLDGKGRRVADGEARRLLGKLWTTVFWAPPGAALEQPTYSAALRLFPSLSSQAYHLRERIREVANLVDHGAPCVEFHPEVSFRALNGRPLSFAKKSWNGQEERRRLLRLAGLDLPDRIEGEAGHVPIDDLLDAAVGAVTASAMMENRAEAVGSQSTATWSDRGVIWHPMDAPAQQPATRRR